MQKIKTAGLFKKQKNEKNFYLARHHFSIDATDVDASIKTGFVMRIHNITAKCLVSTNTTVIRSLLSSKDFCYAMVAQAYLNRDKESKVAIRKRISQIQTKYSINSMLTNVYSTKKMWP